MSTICTDGYEDAPFCTGDSHQGASCEEDGSCDDSFASECETYFDYEWGGCAEDMPVAEVGTAMVYDRPVLPEAGINAVELFVLLTVSIVVGALLVRR